MKKKTVIILAVILAVLLIPVPTGAQEYGGTREFTSLTYKIIDWHLPNYQKTKIYFFPENLKPIDVIYEYEEDEIAVSFVAKVTELSGDMALVEPVEGSAERLSCDCITVNAGKLEDIGAQVGSLVEIAYTGGIMETYPAQINAISWKMAQDLRHMEFTEPWLNEDTAETHEGDKIEDVIITKIYANCFFGEYVIPMPYEIKFNGQLGEDWCVGDQISVYCANGRRDDEQHRIEADMVSVEVSNFVIDPNACYKPVIYLYPEEETPVSVLLQLDGELTCTYPAYGEGWQVTARPDGTLTDSAGQTYNYLYWEGTTNARWDMSEGFCVKGEDSAVFLEQSLAKLGLTRKEANEFIVYWLPLMEQNPYNIIQFQTDAYTQAAELLIDPAPDTVIRVFMTFRAAQEYVEFEPQELTAPTREGFTVVEWGGTQIQ